MKNLFLFCAMACAALLAGINQSKAQNLKPRYGITAGVDLTTMGKSAYYTQSFDFKWRYGFQAGVYADLPLNSRFSITPQILYTQKGGKVDMGVGEPQQIIPGPGVDYSERYAGSTRMNYIDVPVLFTYKPLSKLSVFAGPQVSFLLSQASSFTDKRTAGPIYYINNSRNGFTKVLVGGNVGIGYNYDKHLGLNLHYTYDFQHIAVNATERNSGFAFTASYLF